jgi:hypothetical protein
LFLDGVVWLSLEELGQQADLDPLLALLTLPVRPELELPASSQQILETRLDLPFNVVIMLFERFPTLTPVQIMVIAGIPTDQLLHTRRRDPSGSGPTGGPAGRRCPRRGPWPCR